MPTEIHLRLEALSQGAPALYDGHAWVTKVPASMGTVPKVVAPEPTAAVKLDKAGYFVIVPLPVRNMISVEHYAYDNTLLHSIEGSSARAIYTTIIRHGWVTELSHAAYLGKELARAELMLMHGFQYIQDGA